MQVRAHAGNPVAWQLWSPETLALAKKHNRVLFVSIGYAACHCMAPRYSSPSPSFADAAELKGVMYESSHPVELRPRQIADAHTLL